MDKAQISTLIFIIFLIIAIVYLGLSGPSKKRDVFTMTDFPTPVYTYSKTDLSPTKTLTPVPVNGEYSQFLSWMPETSITDKSSAQYRLNKTAWTDAKGFRRVTYFYIIAVGEYYKCKIGDCLTVSFEDKVIFCIVGDVKKQKDTIQGRYCKENGSELEFIIDKKIMPKSAWSQGNLLRYLGFGKVIDITDE